MSQEKFESYQNLFLYKKYNTFKRMLHGKDILYADFRSPVSDNKKRPPISWKSQIAVGGGARIRTADTAGMNRML